MRVVLIQAPLWGISPPMGIAQLGAFLKERGHEVSAFDANLDLYLRRTKAQLYAFEAGFSAQWTRPDWVSEFFAEHAEFIEERYVRPLASGGGASAVGFSINATSQVASLELAKRLKAANPALKVIFGGQHYVVAPQDADRVLASGAVDAVVLGDGEAGTAELLEAWTAGGDPARVPGLWVRGGGKTVFTGRRAPMELDALPFADYGLFELEKYENYDSSLILLATSRGCVRSCAFCGYRVSTPGYRTMGAERIYREIKHQMKVFPSPKGIYFYDLVANGDMEVLEGLCDRLIADDEFNLPWDYIHFVIRPEMTPAICEKLYKAGCRNAQIGLESGSNHVLSLMKKGQDADTVAMVLKNLKDAGITVKGNFMFGFPGETEKDAEETLEFLKRVAPNLPKVYPSYTFTLIEPASPLNKVSERYGVVQQGEMGDTFWESADGKNSYPVRFARYTRFVKLAEELGLEIEYGYKMPVEAFQAHWLARYYEHQKDWKSAAEQYEAYLKHDPANPDAKRGLDACLKGAQARA